MQASGCWSAPTPITSGAPVASFELAADGERAYAAWIESDPLRSGLPNAFASATLEDGGWASPRRLVTFPLADDKDWSDIALVASSGQAAAVWGRRYTSDAGLWGDMQEVFLARFLPDAGWQPAERVNLQPQWVASGGGFGEPPAGGPRVGLVDQGDVLVLWVEYSIEAGSMSLISRRLTTSGWDAPLRVLNGRYWTPPWLSVGGSNTMAFWAAGAETAAARLVDGGWEAETISLGCGQVHWVNGVVDAEGRALASWTGNLGIEAPGVSARVDGGWSPPTDLNPMSGYNPRPSSMALDGRGQGAMLWYGPINAPDVHLSRFDGTTWLPADTLFTGHTGVGRGTLAMNLAGVGLATWSASDGSTIRTYAARFEDGGAPSIDTFEDGALEGTRAAVTPQGTRWIFFFGDGGMVSHCP